MVIVRSSVGNVMNSIVAGRFSPVFEFSTSVQGCPSGRFFSSTRSGARDWPSSTRRDVPGAEVDLSSLVYRGADPTAIEALFEDLGWKRIATRIRRWAER